MLHEIELNGYEAALIGERYLMFGTRGSYGIEQLHITAGEAWDGLDITATFCPPGEEPVRVLLGRDNCINVPPEATAKATHTVSGHIVFTGVSSGVRRISHDLTYRVADHSGTEDGEGGATPSIIDQILAETKADRVAAAESASAADKSAVDAAASAKAADDAANAALTAKRETEQAAADALQSIAEAETSAVQAVENTGREQFEAVAAAGDTQIGRVSAASDTALAEVTAEGNKQIGLIGDTAAGALDDIKSAKDGALTEISAEGQTQKSTVAAEGAAQLEAIARAATAELGRWAPRIEDTAGPAPVVQTDIAAARWPLYPTFHIDTVQAGEGDPSPENIRPISGRDAVEATLCGRNLLDLSEAYAHGYNITGIKNFLIPRQQYTFSNVSAGGISFGFLIATAPVVSEGVGELKLLHYISEGTSGTFVAPDDVISYPYIILCGGREGIVDVFPNVKMQLEIGATAHPYEPYRGSVTQLPLPKTCYGGKVEWRHNSEFDKCIVLDGSENWRIYRNPNNFAIPASERIVKGLSDSYPTLKPSEIGTQNGIYLSYTLEIIVTDLACSTVEEFKAHLSTHPITVHYQSPAYDGTNGLDVCLTEYLTGFAELDGKNVRASYYPNNGLPYGVFVPRNIIKTNDGVVCSQAKTEPANLNWGYVYAANLPLTDIIFGLIGSDITSGTELNAYLAAQKAAGTPVQVAYQLAAPEVYALPAAPQFAALHDTNTLYCDTGDTEMMFAADTKKYIDSKIETLSTAIAALGTT